MKTLKVDTQNVHARYTMTVTYKMGISSNDLLCLRHTCTCTVYIHVHLYMYARIYDNTTNQPIKMHACVAVGLTSSGV